MPSANALVRFAKESIARHGALAFPSSPAPVPLKDHYVHLKFSDSTGNAYEITDFQGLGPRLVLVGVPGSGKTTALKFLTVWQSEQFIANDIGTLPIYVALRELRNENRHAFIDEIGLSDKLLRETRFMLLLDGLDEIPAQRRAAVLRCAHDFGTTYPDCQIVLASRPAGLSPPPPDEFQFLHLDSFDTAQVRAFISTLADDPSQIEAFETSIAKARFLRGLAHNPLLIRLLWEVYRTQAYLPSVRADLYQTISDFLLSSWDALRGVSRHRLRLDARFVHDLLETLALDAFNDSRYLLSKGQLRDTIARQLEVSGLPTEEVDPVIEQLLLSGILVQHGVDAVSFMHLTFMEFYAAKRLVERFPMELKQLVIESACTAREVILFAAGMILDVAPLVEAAVDRRELILAANCLREGRTENRAFESYVVDQLRIELGSDLVGKLTAAVFLEGTPQPESVHETLRRQYWACKDPKLKPQEKGKLFEKFMAGFFRQSFHIVDLNTNTENGEIDITLENIGSDPFWYELGGDIFVECKNWDSSRPLKETATFANKVRMSRGRLGFFVSVNGFTEDALRTLKNQVADKDAPLIVPITGECTCGLEMVC
jgi:hypothetical protein